jgi:hypothetical protein
VGGAVSAAKVCHLSELWAVAVALHTLVDLATWVLAWPTGLNFCPCPWQQSEGEKKPATCAALAFHSACFTHCS